MGTLVLILSIVGTLLSIIASVLIFRQVYLSRWIDSHTMPMLWVVLIFVACLIIALWCIYFFVFYE
jgi:multisubunit Na+/H+ antiporter MnhG subunit